MQTYVANSEVNPVVGFMPDGYESLKEAMTPVTQKLKRLLR